MSDPWLNFQYMIEFSDQKNGGICSVISINANAVKHGTASYVVNTVRGDPVKRYVYGGTYTEPINVSILLGEGARPWLEWFSTIQSGSPVAARNITLSLYAYGAKLGNETIGVSKGQSNKSRKLWLRWDLINCFPVSWQIGAMAVEDSPSPMKIDMTLQFESMVVMEGDNELHEVMG